MSHSTLRESAMGRRLGVSSEAALRACLFALSLAQTTATFIEDIPCDVGWRTALFQKLARQHALLSNAYKLQQWLLMPLWAGLGFASFLSLEKRVIDAFLLPGLAGFASDGSAQAQVAALARLVLAFLSRAIGALPAWLLAYPRSRIALFAFAWSTGAAVARLAWRLRDNAKALLAADHAAWRRCVPNLRSISCAPPPPLPICLCMYLFLSISVSAFTCSRLILSSASQGHVRAHPAQPLRDGPAHARLRRRLLPRLLRRRPRRGPRARHAAVSERA